jgi:hypothetical protein
MRNKFTHFFAIVGIFPQKVTNGISIQPLVTVQELRHTIDVTVEQLVLLQKAQAGHGFGVEHLDALLPHLLLSLLLLELLGIVGRRRHVIGHVVLFQRGGGLVVLAQIGLGDGVDVQVSAPLDHALEDADEALEPTDAHALLLVGGGAQFQRLPTLRDFGQVVDEAFKDIGSGQITVVVYVNVHYALGISTNSRQSLKVLNFKFRWTKNDKKNVVKIYF